MTMALDQDRARRRSDSAANDDHVEVAQASAYRADTRHPPAHTGLQVNETGGWDAYDVWRRLIKEARERRAGAMFPPAE